MPERMLQFVDCAAADARQARGRPSAARDFRRNLPRSSTGREAAAQASRCSQCGVPFCSVHCPLHNNIPDWLKLTAEGRLEEAYELSSATNNFPEICGRICPQDRLCEGNCVIEKGFESVTIGAVEKLHHRHRLRARLGEAARAARASGRSRWALSAPGPAGWPRPRSCAAAAIRSRL